MTADGTGPRRIGVAGVDPSTLVAPEDVTLVAPGEDIDALLTVGEPALLSALDSDVPILPVDAGKGVRSVPRAAVTDALASLAAGAGERWTVPRLAVSIDDETVTHALMDVMLVTEAPAAISEYAVSTPSDAVAEFRADGVLVSTAPGTSGYARRVDAPVFAPETPAAAVVPVAPFATTLDHWVVPTSADPVVELTVEREEAVVSLLADDRTVGPVEAHTPVTVAVDGGVSLLSLPESQSCFEQSGASPRTGEQ